MKNVIISDIHGDYKKLKELLMKRGIIDEKGKRIIEEEDKRIISIGDLASCSEDDLNGDLKCLRKVGIWIDVLLMGNHEYPYINPMITWSKFHYYKKIHEELLRIDSEKRLQPAIVVKDYLVSHAGWDKDNHPYINTATEALNAIQDRLSYEGWSNRWFSAIGKSRTDNQYAPKHGGILWEDFNDLRSSFPQIVGHTSDKAIRVKTNAMCIDTGKSGCPTLVEL